MPTLINGKRIIGGFEDTFEAVEGIFREVSGKDEESETKENKAQPEHAKEAQEKKSIEKTGVIYFNQRVASELAQAQAEVASKPTVEMQRSKINTLLGLQEAYEGSVDAQGNITKYHQAEAEKKEAEAASGSQIQQGREQKKAQSGSSGSFEMGENELGLGGENKNHFTTAVG